MNDRLRTALITWLVVYPMITALLAILEPWVSGWPMPLRTLLLSALMVPLMVLWAMPLATTKFAAFLNPNTNTGNCHH